jgi:hypothetical protein
LDAARPGFLTSTNEILMGADEGISAGMPGRTVNPGKTTGYLESKKGVLGQGVACP